MPPESPTLPMTAVGYPGRPPEVFGRYRWPTLVSACLVIIVNIVVLAGLRLPPFIGPALGFWFVLVQPVYLVWTMSFWDRCGPAERFGYSLASVLMLLMLTGLAADLVLPVIGVGRPLDPVPVVLVADLLTIALYLIRHRYPDDSIDTSRALTGLLRIGPEGSRLLAGGALCVALAVLGANRLNNGAGDQVSLAALGVAALTLVFLLLWRYRVAETVTAATLYLTSLGLLLMTSLRGWYVTGHDIQTEYQVFRLTQAHGHWEIAAFHSAYNACLSLTILPTELAGILHVDPPYIYKVFFQVIFAACPVLVYTIARRYWSVPVAILAASYFISFPTFFTDMPYINRQEIGLLFVCAAVLAITSKSWDIKRRRLTFILACAGVEISHYSSMYIFLWILAAGWVIYALMLLDRHLPRRNGARAAHAGPAQWATATRTVGIGSVLIVAALTVGWGALATQSAGAVLTDARAAISGLFGHTTSARSSNVAYNILFSKTPTPQAVLNDYNQAVLKIRAATADVTLYVEPQGVVSQYQIKAVAQPLLPLTTGGRLLSDIGVPVAGFNSFVRQFAAQAEQLFLLAGIIIFLLIRKFRKQVGLEFFCLSAGSLAALATVTVLPDLSVDYGILRVFQEALIIVAPILASGSIAILRPLGDVWAPRVAAALCIGIFASTTGMLPQLLGGYSPQLSLNNSGQYYDSYYTHQQEVAGTRWLSGQLGTLPSGVQATHASNRFLFTSLSKVTGQQFVEDAFPSLLRQRAWVILDYSILHTGLASVTYDGDIIDYRFPVGILKDNKNLVYDNSGMEIYR